MIRERAHTDTQVFSCTARPHVWITDKSDVIVQALRGLSVGQGAPPSLRAALLLCRNKQCIQSIRHLQHGHHLTPVSSILHLSCITFSLFPLPCMLVFQSPCQSNPPPPVCLHLCSLYSFLYRYTILISSLFWLSCWSVCDTESRLGLEH